MIFIILLACIAPFVYAAIASPDSVQGCTDGGSIVEPRDHVSL